MLAFGCLALCASAYGSSEIKCMVASEDGGGWGREHRVDVQFYSAREMNPDEQRSFPIYAKIWLGSADFVIVTLNGRELVTPEFADSMLEKMFRYGDPIYAQETPPYNMRWRIRAVVDGKWVDSRYPQAFDPLPLYRRPR